MRRNWKTIQSVLEATERDELEEKLATLRQEDEAEFFGHLLLCVDAGLVDELAKPRLTMAGHDVLAAIRSKTVWTEIKRQADKAMVPITVMLIQSVLARLSSAP